MLSGSEESPVQDREHPKDETGCSRNGVNRNVSLVKPGSLLHLAESAYDEIPRGRRKVLCCLNSIWIHINASFGGDDERNTNSQGDRWKGRSFSFDGGIRGPLTMINSADVEENVSIR